MKPMVTFANTFALNSDFSLQEKEEGTGADLKTSAILVLENFAI